MIDPKLIEELKARRAKIAAAGGNDKLEARRAKGLMTARDRLLALFDADTAQEFGAHAQHTGRHFGQDKKDLPTDAVICMTGRVNGRPVAAFSQDFTVAGGTLGNITARKIVQLMEYALKAGMPVVGINDSGGARIQEAVESLSGYGKVFYTNVLLSGVVPQVAIIAGPCAGGAAYSPALMDFLIMVQGSANMFICGPDVIKAATGESCTMDQVGSATAHGTVSGNIHFIAENDAHAIALSKKLLSYLPTNNIMDPPHRLEVPVEKTYDAEMNAIVPASARDGYDVRLVIKRLVDEQDFFEVQAGWAKTIVVGFARIMGVVVGIIANNPAFKGGVLDIDSSDKAARFIRTCNVYNVPVVNLVDVPGFLPGMAQERGGIIRHGAKMLFAYASATVPKITVILRKAYGGAYLAMCSQDLGADLVLAWPTAEIAVMGAEGAIRILYKKEVESAADPAAKSAELAADYRAKFASPYQAASLAMVTDVIEPAETRTVVGLALRNLLSKREVRPPKKHGNIPL